MAVLLALFSAATYGVGDFCGGMAARRIPASTVLLWSHMVGLGLLLAARVRRRRVGDRLATSSSAASAGSAARPASGFLYKGLSVGPMSVVAPITALLAARSRSIAGLLEGERPAAAVARRHGRGAARHRAGVGRGRRQPAPVRSPWRSASPWAPASGSVCSSCALAHRRRLRAVAARRRPRGIGDRASAALALLGPVPRTPPRPAARGLTAAAGALDAAANVLYLLAVREGLLSVVSVLAALYPVSTVILARLVLHERFARLQRIGMALALPAADPHGHLTRQPVARTCGRIDAGCRCETIDHRLGRMRWSQPQLGAGWIRAGGGRRRRPWRGGARRGRRCGWRGRRARRRARRRR